MLSRKKPKLEDARKPHFVSRVALESAEVIVVDTPDAMAVPLPEGTVAVGFAHPGDYGSFAIRSRYSPHSLPLMFWLERGLAIAGDDIEALLPSRCERRPLAFFVNRVNPCTESGR